MPAFTSTSAPVHTLWDTPDTAIQRLPGIWVVTTPSHGGFVLSDERQAAMPDALRHDGIYYEEDVNWSLVVIGFETEFAALKDPLFDIECNLAHQTARHWRPMQYGAFTGDVISPSDSYVLKKVALYEAAIGKIGVRSASGDWADWVPKGKIGVTGQRITGCDHLGFAQYEGPYFKGLCDAARYDSSRPINTFAALDVELVP
ncbi:DUF7007 domain-containing protein [Sphingomonas sp. Leaf30]|uniref:DUF7007 domain-containing protein n=1 Tax=Sphingomonas sp. Leaf30 TaxID=1736213 RepID=UPI0006F6CD6D|nr:hypothetical protein [Sphingomonas sp. Leaf30]KQN16520.1 hypothetical protein ASE89_07835 [Sphingomonas sp. Leaf30]